VQGTGGNLQRVKVGNALDWPDLPIGAATAANGLVWTAGLVSVDPDNGDIVTGDIRVQTKRVLDNLDLVLKAAGSDRSGIVMVQAFLADIRRDFEGFNEIYSTYFDTESAPPRYTVEATLALDGLLVEIHAVATTETA
jgi:2-iminobutanoate/2-iminopropanoate deaminase